MPAATEPPSVALSFANNFWGKDDAGVAPMLDRMAAAKQTNDELRSFYGARAAIEEDYARKLLSLCRKSLGSQEMGTLKHSLDTVRGEVESMGKQHALIAAQMKTELEEPLGAFAAGMKERRKIVQNTIEKLLKIKIQQTNAVNKTRDRYEQDCLKIKGYLAQGHMVMGQEERKNKAKLEKTQISVATTNTEYENAVKALEDTTARWNREWKAATDKFQDLEEERLDFTKSSLWTFANVASTVCVSDDASCEKIRLSLEKMDVEKDIVHFITEKGTGQEIPDPPKYINFCRGDVDDHVSEASDDDAYSVAQFPRSINPAFRSSSPQPSTFESHHDPNSALAREMGHQGSSPLPNREATSTPQKMSKPQVMNQRDSRQGSHGMQQKYSVVTDTRQPAHENQYVRRQAQPTHYIDAPPPQPSQYADASPQPTQYIDAPPQNYNSRPEARPQQSYDASQFAAVPHDPYPMDGMTMLCRTDGMNSATSSNLSARPSSRDENSDYSNPTSLSSAEPFSGKASPVKQPEPSPAPEPERRMLKKKSGFFQNHSPFRRKSVKDLQPVSNSNPNRNTWGPTTMKTPVEPHRPQICQPSQPSSQRDLISDRAPSPDPIDANASLALNVGQNVFPVSNTDRRNKSAEAETPAAEDQDPIALALAELKGVTSGKQSAGRISADHYHGIATPAPEADRTRPLSRAAPAPRAESVATVAKGPSPPSYEQPVQRLGVPPPAVTSKAMKEASRKYTEQTQTMFSRPATTSYAASTASPAATSNRSGTTASRPVTTATRPTAAPTRPAAAAAASASPRPTATPTRPATRHADVPRAASPAPPRSASPRPGMHPDTRQAARSASPNPYAAANHRPPSQMSQRPQTQARNSEQGYYRHNSSGDIGSASPNPHAGGGQRPPSQMSQRPQTQARGSEQSYYRHNSSSDIRAASPAASFRGSWNSRPASRASRMGGSDMAIQLAPIGPDAVGSSAGSEYGGSVRGRGTARPGTSASNRGAMGLYDGRDPAQEGNRQRSKSVADPSRQYTPEGRPILHYARALYLYQAAIPEELGFAKGDILAVLRHQDDGWWEAEIHSGAGQGRNGLVPSNYLQPC